MLSLPCRGLLPVCLALFHITVICSNVDSEDRHLDQVNQDQVTGRFMQVLLRRPRLGTALDRVYGYHVQAGTIDQFIEDLETEVETSGDDRGQKTMLLGLFEMHRGRNIRAVAALKRAESLMTEDSLVSYYLGKSLLLIGNDEAAAAAFRRALDRGPERNETLQVFTQLARLYHRVGQNEKALKVWNELESVFPGDHRVGERIAAALTEEGQLESALQRYQLLTRQSDRQDDFRSIGYQVAAAELKRRLGRHTEATADLEQILNQVRPGSWLHSDFRTALDYQERLAAIADTRENRRAVLALMIRSGQTNHIDEAFDRLQGFEDPVVIISMIDSLMNRGDYRAATRICRMALSHDDERWELQVRLAFLLVLMNQCDEAIKLADAIRTSPIPDATTPISRTSRSQRATSISSATTVRMPRFARI